ncbi:MAG TPA: MurT ligase domain-containing protein [Candidatus Saccharimonadales bacterium]|nr:MurT ligase domain-containing protein [Candidatus Saccharimonadales bacterium]
MPLFITIAIAKLILRTSRLFGRGGGSALPGLVAERIDPNIGRKLAARLHDGCIIVTGTNGKTTTAKMIAGILSDAGEGIVSNRAGSNLSRGIVSALVEHASFSGHFSESVGLFEVDEAAMPAVCTMVRPRAIIVLNLFRDQLDRYGELDSTAQLIGKGIAATSAQVYLNADDPRVAGLASFASADRVTYFGVEGKLKTKLAHDVTADSSTCPVCGKRLVYTQTYFGHIGHYRCREGHFERPVPDYSAENVELQPEAVSFTLKSHEPKVQLGLPGLYNVYNALAAVTFTVHHQGITFAGITQSLERIKPAFGRAEKLEVEGRTLHLLLVKNPTGFNQIIQTFLLQEKQQNLLILINDNFADGRDVSWLWDVAFEDLQAQHPRIAVSGIRANDMALRLKYADIATELIEPEATRALNQFIAQLPAGAIGYIIPTYTALLESRRYLSRRTHLKGVWQ